MKRDWREKQRAKELSGRRKESHHYLPLDYKELNNELRMKIWLKDRGMTLGDLAREVGVCASYPGKILIAQKEKPSPELRERLLLAGIPEDMV